jgi:hypothetical protein
MDLTKDLPSTPSEKMFFPQKYKRVKRHLFNTQDASTITDTQ